MIGGLMYLTTSRPNIAFATFVCARYQARPTVKQLKEVKRIFRYLRQTYNMELQSKVKAEAPLGPLSLSGVHSVRTHLVILLSQPINLLPNLLTEVRSEGLAIGGEAKASLYSGDWILRELSTGKYGIENSCSLSKLSGPNLFITGGKSTILIALSANAFYLIDWCHFFSGARAIRFILSCACEGNEAGTIESLKLRNYRISQELNKLFYASGIGKHDKSVLHILASSLVFKERKLQRLTEEKGKIILSSLN
ncbi:hypothetical protein Tco_1067690 [Tanacetum coccineum]|uniref:Uncharacterized protein n=1 Tax=Tanacetum coccineum TaxID=301880 RepID=A0ABQ5HFP6_9ASTR